MKARQKFEKKKERERAVRKKILYKRAKLRAEVKEIKRLEREEAAAQSNPNVELGKNENS